MNSKNKIRNPISLLFDINLENKTEFEFVLVVEKKSKNKEEK